MIFAACSYPGRLASVDLPAEQARSGSGRVGGTLSDVRLTEFWDRMRAQFGEAYAQSVARDFVFDGVDVKVVWRAVCDTFKVPENLR